MDKFTNRRWLIIPTSLTGSINFDQVLENSIESLRVNVDETLTFVKYEITIIEEPYIESYINSDTGEETQIEISPGIYGRPDIYSELYPELNYNEMISLLSTSEWNTGI